MSSITLGPPVSLDGPLPQAPLHSLLSAAQIVPTGDDRFLSGGVIWPYPPGLPDAQDPCSTGTFRTKSDGEGWDLPPFGSYTLYLPITCSSITAHAPGFADRATLAFQATESFGVAQELAMGAAMPANPFLCDAALDILAGGVAQTPSTAMSYLEEAIGATGRQGMILTSPAVGAAFNSSGYHVEPRNGRLVTTANETLVVLDGGFASASPSLHAPLTAGQGWAFATGPIQVRRTEVEVMPGEISEAIDRGENIVTFRAERGYLVTWDTSLQAGVLVDWTP